MSWIQPVVQGATFAYNLYQADRDYNGGRVAAYLRNRRRRNPSSIMPRGLGVYKRRRIPVDDPVGDVQYNGGYVNDRHVKSRKTLGRVNVRKLAREGVCAIYDRWQSMGLYGKQTGNMSLAKDAIPKLQNGADANAVTKTCPMYLWDLSCVRNYNAGNEYVPEAAYQVCRTSDTGNIVFNRLRGQNITTGDDGADKGTCGYQWYETPKSALYLDAPFDTALLDWVKCQFVFFGSKKTSHKIWIDVVQMDPLLQPSQHSTKFLPGDALGTTQYSIAFDEASNTIDGRVWYTNELARLMDGPFATYGGQKKKMLFKVLHRKVVEFTPVSSYEEAGSALCHKQTVNMFLKMGRKHNFAWKQSAAPDQTILGDTNIETDVERGDHVCVVHPNARVWLVVRSQVYNKVGDDAAFTVNSDCAPSFDLRISRKWLVSS